jgi:hypothetical protein
MPPRPLPPADDLPAAVVQVIQNQVGRPATRFIAATQNGQAQNLVEIVSNLIMNAEAVEFRENELREFPYLLTIEDYVARRGSEWHFEDRITRRAGELSQWYDRIANLPHGRYR